VAKQVRAPEIQDQTDYLSGFQYKNGELQFFPTAEGYVKVTDGGKFNYVYNYTDHLGNIRVSYSLNPADGELKILEENHYYPFGLKHSNYNVEIADFDKDETGIFAILKPVERKDYQYKYNGKELQDELGLNWYDYGARNYDPAIGRFFNMDRYSETFMPISTYQYAANNPINYVDYNGDYITLGINDKDGNQIYSVLYENGKAYHYSKDSKGGIVKGGEYDGDSSFVENAVTDLNKISGTKQGGHIVSELQRSSSNYDIGDSGDAMINNFDHSNNQLRYSQQGSGIIDGVSMNKSFIKLGHELAHAYDKDRGFDMSKTIFGGLKETELNAVRFENYLRANDGESTMRTSYSKYNLRSRMSDTSPDYFKSFVTPLGKHERYKSIYAPSTLNTVDNTRVYRPSKISVRYDTRDNIFKN
jgi:RHS repeat-associated protein